MELKCTVLFFGFIYQRSEDKMLAFPGMLVDAAEKAGMKVPQNADEDSWSGNEYPHFYVFCKLQLGRIMRPGEHWENAKR